MNQTEVKATLKHFSQRMEELEDQLGVKPFGAAERAKSKELYTSLKNDFKAAAHYGTTDGGNRPRTDVEDAYYYPAICGALTYLKPAINSDPLATDWFSAIENAKCDIDAMLCQLEGGID